MAGLAGRDWGWEAALLAAAAMLFFTSLGCPLQEPEEPRYAEIPRQMLQHDSWLVPVLHGQPYYDKPPLLYWLVMSAYAVFGVHDWAARLVASAIGLAIVAVTYLWGRAVAGRQTALAGAFVLCLSARFVYLSHLLTMNGLLCLCVTAALAAAHRALTSTPFSWRWWWLSALLTGIGILAKGPVALVLVMVPVLLASIAGCASFRIGAGVGFAAVASAVAAPWFIALALRDPEFLHYFFWKHHIERYVAPFDHAKPAWYYLPEILLGMLPWTLLLPGLMREVWRRRSERRSEAFFLIAAGFALAFFSVAGSKRAGYILPVMPPLALALGSYLATFAARRSSVIAGALTFAVLLFANLFLLPSYAARFALRDEVQPERSATEPVYCYPHRWDSVSFYLQRDDVRVLPRGAMLVKDVSTTPHLLVFVKNEQSLRELVEELPPALQFVPQARGRVVTVGAIRPRSLP